MANKKTEKTVEKIDKDFLKDIKVELESYLQDRINYETEQAMKRYEKRLLKQKNHKILFRDILIIILILIIGLLLKEMYENGYFNNVLKNTNLPIVNTNKENKNESTESEEPSAEEESQKLINKYAYLLEKYKISYSSSEAKVLYSKGLDNEIKLVYAFNNLSKELLEDEYIMLEDALLENSATDLFSNSKVTHTSFKISDTTVKYIKSKKLYVLEDYSEKDDYIKNKVLEVKETDKGVEITTLGYYVKDNNLYSATGSLVTSYKNDETLLKNEKKLTRVTFVFVKTDDKYLLDAVEVK